jgi:hypothetical protein
MTSMCGSEMTCNAAALAVTGDAMFDWIYLGTMFLRWGIDSMPFGIFNDEMMARHVG